MRVRLPISSVDRNTFRAWATELRRINFLTAEDNAPVPRRDWTPAFTANGTGVLTNANTRIERAQYRVSNADEVSFWLEGTVTKASGTANGIKFTLPVKAAKQVSPNRPGFSVYHLTSYANLTTGTATLSAPGWGLIQTTDTGTMLRYDAANLANLVWRFSAYGCYIAEV